MAILKMTFSLNTETVGMLNDAATRLAKPKSEIVRNAIQDYYARVDRLSESERVRMLAAVDNLLSEPSPRSAEEVDGEIHEIRKSRRSGGRRTLVG